MYAIVICNEAFDGAGALINVRLMIVAQASAHFLQAWKYRPAVE